MKRINSNLVIINLVLSLLMILMIVFNGKAFAQENPFNHGKFYEAKMQISNSIIEIANSMKSEPNKIMFEALLKTKLDEIKKSFPIDFQIAVVDQENNPNGINLLATAIIEYQDEKNFIGWKFDTVFTNNMVFAFVLTLKERTVPDVGWEDYYKYKVLE